MPRFIVRCVVNAMVFYLIAFLFPVVRLASPATALLAGAILGLVNVLVKPLLFLLTLPINLLTLGLFTCIVNTWMVMLTDRFVAGLHIPGFWLALLTALLISCFNIMFTRSHRRREWN